MQPLLQIKWWQAYVGRCLMWQDCSEAPDFLPALGEEKGTLLFWAVQEGNSRSGAFWRGSSGGGALAVGLEAEGAVTALHKCTRQQWWWWGGNCPSNLQVSHPSSRGKASTWAVSQPDPQLWLGVRKLASLPVWHLIFQEHLNPWVLLGRFSRRFWLCNKSHLILFLHCC